MENLNQCYLGFFELMSDHHLGVSPITDLHVPVAPRRALGLRGVVDVPLGGHSSGDACEAAVEVLDEDGHLGPAVLALLVKHPGGVGGVVKVEGQVGGRGRGSVVEAEGERQLR